jgi:hypothetical protein
MNEKSTDIDWEKFLDITMSSKKRAINEDQMSDYVRFNRLSDAKASIDEFCYCLARTSDDEKAWKYAIISIHNALQGYICISLRNGNSFQTWNERHLTKWLEAYHNDKELPNTKLDYFMELFDKAFPDETILNRRNIEWLNETRNTFIHFNTDSFSVSRSSAILCCREAMEAIKLTPFKAVGIFFYDEEQKNAFEISCKKADELFAAYRR